MKVVKITGSFYPKSCGVADYTRLLCEQTVNLKEDIFFYVITSIDADTVKSGYSHEGIEVLPLIRVWSFSALVQIRKKIEEISPDIIHIEYNRALYGCKVAINFLAYFLKKDNPDYKIVITFHDLPHPIKGRDPFFWLTSFFLLFYCDKIILTNNRDFNSFSCRFSVVKRKCSLIPVGSNVERLEADPALIKKELNISDNTLILSFFGFIREEKDLSRLLYAFYSLVRKEKNLRLFIIGGVLNEKIFSFLISLSRKLKINDLVKFTNYQSKEKVSEFLSISDIAILPYKNGIDTNSGAFAACVLHGLPIVATSAKFIPDIIKSNYNLMLVEPGSTKRLVNALSRMVREPDLREKLSENLKKLNVYFSWQSISEKIFKIYKNLS